MNKKDLWIWLAQCPGLRQGEKLGLVERFGGIQALYEAGEDRLTGLKGRALAGLSDKDLTETQGILASCDRLGAGILTWADSNYPPALRSIADPPLVLYYLGCLPDWDSQLLLGIVGTRKSAPYANMEARRIAAELCHFQVGVVSGMAMGVDAYATIGALDARGCAIGVLGGGIDTQYPAANRGLYRRMGVYGLLLTEYAPGTQPRTYTFPQRNRIISGLSQGVLVIQAQEKSGSMITARKAQEQGRLLFTLDDPTAAGNQQLLREGAKTVVDGQQIYFTLWEKYIDKGDTTSYHGPENTVSPASSSPAARKEPQIPLSPAGQAIVSLLKEGMLTVDEAIAATGLPSHQALSEITMLELQGVIYRLGAQHLILKNS